MNKQKYIITGVGVLLGFVLGYVYYHLIGCATGSCAITSKPLNSTLYGGMMGGLLFSMFISPKTEGKKEK